ncbi:hypothetical protein Q1695_013463 [Nippostrongylus brasiliensis]|nr:hypothetical protein Q1695_013463 [Nippostrongylus brasiliensis]
MRRQMTRSGLRRYLYAAAAILLLFLMYRWFTRRPEPSPMYGYRGEIADRFEMSGFHLLTTNKDHDTRTPRVPVDFPFLGVLVLATYLFYPTRLPDRRCCGDSLSSI